MTPALFHETVIDALRDVVQGLGGAKAVGAKMRPDKSADVAARWISDCLNPDRAERFDPDQVLWLLRQGREHGCHAAANFLMRECGYADPVPVEPEDEIARAQREFTTAVAALPVLVDRLARLGVKVAA